VLQRGATALRLFHNREAAAAFDRYADAYRPDLVHQHGLARQFSPSVLERARSRGIPTVLTLHDYSLRCPSGDLSRPGELECLNVSCAGHRYDRAVRFRCVHDSRAASALAAVELLAARALRRYERSVDVFLAPSEYVAQRMRETGVPAGRLRVMPNAVQPKEAPDFVDDGYILGFGRLVPTKGFDLMIEMARLRPAVRFVIAGDGPESGNLRRMARGLPNVELVGFVDGDRLDRVVRGARAVIVPSEWPEPFGMVVLEAWNAGRPVIVARTGGVSELVRQG
jgi:glycosyltransferase involved in cell wall biosynthesis